MINSDKGRKNAQKPTQHKLYKNLCLHAENPGEQYVGYRERKVKYLEESEYYCPYCNHALPQTMICGNFLCEAEGRKFEK